MNRPKAFDRAYLAQQLDTHDVHVDGKTYKRGDTLPTQDELDALLAKRRGVKAPPAEPAAAIPSPIRRATPRHT